MPAGLCFKAHRRCNLKIFDYRLGQYWGYANGETWDAPSFTRGPFRNATRFSIFHNPFHNASALTELLARLRGLQDSHIHLQFKTSLPFGSDAWIGSMPLVSVGSETIDQCFCRYVTQPRFLDMLSPNIRAPRVAYHLRTGFADVLEGSLMTDGPDAVCAPTGAATRAARVTDSWIDAACVRERLEASGGYVMSDAPQLVARLTSSSAEATVATAPGAAQPSKPPGGASAAIAAPRVQSSSGLLLERDDAPPATSGPVLGEHAALRRARQKSTRSWGVGSAPLLSVAADFFVAGLASEVQETHKSSFTNPLVARSVCVHTRRWVHEPARGACPSFHQVCARLTVHANIVAIAFIFATPTHHHP